jgi:hypothetical protein
MQEVLQSSTLAEVVFKALSMRERFRQVTDLRRLYNDVDKITHGNANEDEFNRVIQNMEKAGLGRFVAGRKNNPDRFKWTNKNIAKSIKEGKLEDAAPKARPTTLEPQSPEFVEIQQPAKSPVQEAIGTISKENAITYINIKIPLNVSLDSLQEFISTLKALKA